MTNERKRDRESKREREKKIDSSSSWKRLWNQVTCSVFIVRLPGEKKDFTSLRCKILFFSPCYRKIIMLASCYMGRVTLIFEDTIMTTKKLFVNTFVSFYWVLWATVLFNGSDNKFFFSKKVSQSIHNLKYAGWSKKPAVLIFFIMRNWTKIHRIWWCRVLVHAWQFTA